MIVRLKDYIWGNRFGLGVLFVTWLVFFSPLLFDGKIYFFDDLKAIYYPLEHEYGQAQREWRLPVWSNEFGFGHPLLAWGQLGFFTPLHLLLRAFELHPLVLLNVSLMSYFLVGLLGMFVFLRVRLFSQAAAALGAALFVFNGFHIGHLNHVNFWTSTMLLPWLLLAAHSVIRKSTSSRSAALALVAAAIVLSGQPQVVVFTFIAAGIVSLAMFLESVFMNRSWKQVFGTICFTVLAGVIGLGLSSFAIFPLLEFLPLTERAAGLDPSELFEFSFPPTHIITLIEPYFFGDHENYWGAKSFQELGVFVGIIPLMLVGAALTGWKKYRAETIAGVLLICISVILALGQYSVVYRYLVDQHILTSLGVAGRFVFFFVMGVSLLAPVGVDNKKRIAGSLAGVTFAALLFIPFALAIQDDARLIDRFFTTVSSFSVYGIVIGLGAVLFVFRVSLPRVVVMGAIASLIVYSWEFNPLADRRYSLLATPFSDSITAYNESHSTPARLYSRERLVYADDAYVAGTLRTDAISPDFSVYQQIHLSHDDFSCLLVPFQRSEASRGEITISILPELSSAPVRVASMRAGEVSNIGDQRICFDPIHESAGKTFWVSLTSVDATGTSVKYERSVNPVFPAYFTRVRLPTDEEWERSKKEAHVSIFPLFVSDVDQDVLLLQRHLQASSGASSARWIGALSLRPYREFIEAFFANDADPIDGDGLHAIQRNRELLNMSGITHLIQEIPASKLDGMEQAGFRRIREVSSLRGTAALYENPSAYPKAYLVTSASFEPAADEVRAAMRAGQHDVRTHVFVDGPLPPSNLPSVVAPALGNASVVHYTPTHVDVEVVTPIDAVLVLTDAWTPQWHTTVDGNPALQLNAYKIFKAAFVPAGTHIVSFQYQSDAVALSKILTLISLITVAALFLLHQISGRILRGLR